MRAGKGSHISVQNPSLFSLDYESQLTVYSGELQQIHQTHANTLIAGVRYQSGQADTASELDRQLTGVVRRTRVPVNEGSMCA